MIDSATLQEFADEFGIDKFSVLREYLQATVLNELFSLDESRELYFKGGTALRFLFGSNRFSEDLDFSTNLNARVIDQVVTRVVKQLQKQLPGLTIREIKSIAGVTKKLALKTEISTQALTIRLDFSQRESVLRPKQGVVKTSLPVTTVALINYLAAEEILAEKYRAITKRSKGRDVYDLWYLLNRGVKWEAELIRQKLNYYQEDYQPKKLVKIIQDWNEKDLIKDVRRFLPERDRAVLGKLKELTLEAIGEHLGEG